MTLEDITHKVQTTGTTRQNWLINKLGKGGRKKESYVGTIMGIWTLMILKELLGLPKSAFSF